MIFFIGFMGVGKTFLGRKLAELWQMDFFDLDEEIEKTAGKDVNWIFQYKGEAYFRLLESKILTNWKKEGIIATGGGVVIKENNRNFLKANQNTVVWLCPNWDVINSRILNSNRPMVLQRSKEELFALYCERQIFYRECADIKYDGNDLNVLDALIKSK
jgi:Shikimate kinase